MKGKATEPCPGAKPDYQVFGMSVPVGERRQPLDLWGHRWKYLEGGVLCFIAVAVSAEVCLFAFAAGQVRSGQATVRQGWS